MLGLRHNAVAADVLPGLLPIRGPQVLDESLKTEDVDTSQGMWDFTDLRVNGVPIGGSAAAFKSITAAGVHVVLADDSALLMDPALGAQTVQLPAAPANGRRLVVKHDTGTGNVTVDGNGKLIDGAATFSLSSAFAAVELGYFGGTWHVLP